MAGQIRVGDIVRDQWGCYEVAEVEDTPHGRLLKLRLSDDEFEPSAWIGEVFVTRVGEQAPLFEGGE